MGMASFFLVKSLHFFVLNPTLSYHRDVIAGLRVLWWDKGFHLCDCTQPKLCMSGGSEQVGGTRAQVVIPCAHNLASKHSFTLTCVYTRKGCDRLSRSLTHPLRGTKGINELWCIHTTEYYSRTKRNKLLLQRRILTDMGP